MRDLKKLLDPVQTLVDDLKLLIGVKDAVSQRTHVQVVR